MGQCHHRNLDPTGATSLTFRDLKAKEVRLRDDGKWMQINRFPILLSIKMGWRHFRLLDLFTDQATTNHPPPPNQSRQRRILTRAKHSRFQSGPPLKRTLGVHQNTTASDTKLTPSLGIYYISHPLVMDKLIAVNSRVITSPLKMSRRY